MSCVLGTRYKQRLYSACRRKDPNVAKSCNKPNPTVRQGSTKGKQPEGYLEAYRVYEQTESSAAGSITSMVHCLSFATDEEADA